MGATAPIKQEERPLSRSRSNVRNDSGNGRAQYAGRAEDFGKMDSGRRPRPSDIFSTPYQK